MSEPPIEVIDATGAGVHEHHGYAHSGHDHDDLRGEIAAIRGEIEAARMVQDAEESAVAADVAVEASFDAQAAVEALRLEILERLDSMAQTPATPVIVDPGPAGDHHDHEEPDVPSPPVEKHQPKTKKSSGLNWFG